MLAPIRDYLSPRDPRSSPLLCATRDSYFTRLSVYVSPGSPWFDEAQWIVSEDVNVEHLLDVLTSIDPKGDDIWDTCFHFMEHLCWYKPRKTMLRSKIENLPDSHPHKPKCLSELSRLLGKVGNYPEQKHLLTRTLELERERGDDTEVAYALKRLSRVNRILNLYEEGIGRAKEALEIFERINDTAGQAQCSDDLAWLLFDDNQLDAAETVASHAMNLVSEESHGFILSHLHRILGKVYHSKGDKGKAIHHFETAIRIASPSGWSDALFWSHFGLTLLFGDEGEFDNANTHIELAKPYAANDVFLLGRAMKLQAEVWHQEHRFEEAKSEVLCALEAFEKLGAVRDAETCKELLQEIERALEKRST